MKFFMEHTNDQWTLNKGQLVDSQAVAGNIR